MNAALSSVLISLMQGVTYQEDDLVRWQVLLEKQVQVREHVGLLGLELILDESEGYAFLRQRPSSETSEEIPRLVPRRQLGYSVSLILALLRKRLAEADASSGESRLILSLDDIANLVRVFLPEGANEARWMDRIDSDVKKIAEMGFVRRLRGQDDKFEIRRILKAFVDAQWLNALHQKLAEYRTYNASAQSTAEESRSGL